MFISFWQNTSKCHTTKGYWGSRDDWRLGRTDSFPCSGTRITLASLSSPWRKLFFPSRVGWLVFPVSLSLSIPPFCSANVRVSLGLKWKGGFSWRARLWPHLSEQNFSGLCHFLAMKDISKMRLYLRGSGSVCTKLNYGEMSLRSRQGMECRPGVEWQFPESPWETASFIHWDEVKIQAIHFGNRTTTNKMIICSLILT